MNELLTTSANPLYISKSEVLCAAFENKEYFESYSESLKNAWKFYKRKR